MDRAVELLERRGEVRLRLRAGSLGELARLAREVARLRSLGVVEG
jgi:hypothetical protein